MSDIKLNEFDKLEMWEVAQKCKPGITWDEFEKMWADFQKIKQKKSQQ